MGNLKEGARDRDECDVLLSLDGFSRVDVERIEDRM
jgi:hypothetical protein